MNHRRASHGQQWAIATAFALSGVAGLAYEIVWSRYLALILGYASYAVVAVLCAFMGGLAIGNAWLGARVDRVHRPLLFFGVLEIAIGLYAVLFPLLFALAREGYLLAASGFQTNIPILLILKFGVSCLLILPPTILMGATLPALAKYWTHHLQEVRGRVSLLYGLNSAGAVVGCWAAGFWWIPDFGLPLTLRIAAFLSLTVGLTALIISSQSESGSRRIETSVADAGSTPSTIETYTPSDIRLAIVAIGVSGFAAMLYQIAWTRVLGLVLGSSSHAFSLMLMIFIGGIAVGSGIVMVLPQRFQSLKGVALSQAALAGTLFVSLYQYEKLPFWFGRLSSLLARSEEAYPLYQFFQAMVCFGVMFIPAIFMGMSVPLVSRVATQALSQFGGTIGKVFAVNTLGTVLGAALSGLWLLPALGLSRLLGLGIGLNAATAFFLWPYVSANRRKLAMGLAPLLVVVFTILCGNQFDATWRKALPLGLWRLSDPPKTLAAYREAMDEESILYYRDGASATVNLNQYMDGTSSTVLLRVNGKPDASSGKDMSTQVLSGQIPLMLRPDSKDVLVVGLGSGVTCGSVGTHPSVQSIDTIEISAEVIEAARGFRDFNHNVLEDPRLRLITDDAKSFLLLTEKRYDVIISEPSNPWMAGIAGVFSKEFYQTCSDRLNENGLMLQWCQLYETSDEVVELVLATFREVFPYMSLWQSAPGDLLILGSRQSVNVDWASMVMEFEEPQVKADLRRIAVTRLPVLLACEVLSESQARFAAPVHTPVHLDTHPVLEYRAQRAFFARRQAQDWQVLDEKRQPNGQGLLAQYLKGSQLINADFRAFAEFHKRFQVPTDRLFRSLLDAWSSYDQTTTLPLEVSAWMTDRGNMDELEAARLMPLRDFFMETAEHNPQPLWNLFRYAMNTYRSKRSIFHVPPVEALVPMVNRLLETDPANRRQYLLTMAELEWDRGDFAEFGRLANWGLSEGAPGSNPIEHRRDPTLLPETLARLMRWHLDAERYLDALSYSQQAIELGFTQRQSPHYHPRASLYATKTLMLSEAHLPEQFKTPSSEPSQSQQP